MATDKVTRERDGDGDGKLEGAALVADLADYVGRLERRNLDILSQNNRFVGLVADHLGAKPGDIDNPEAVLRQILDDARIRHDTNVIFASGQREAPFAVAVTRELKAAREKHKPQINSPHEGFAVIYEEVQEYLAEVMAQSNARDSKKMLKELVQIAAMAERVAEDTGLVDISNK